MQLLFAIKRYKNYKIRSKSARNKVRYRVPRFNGSQCIAQEWERQLETSLTGLSQRRAVKIDILIRKRRTTADNDSDSDDALLQVYEAVCYSASALLAMHTAIAVGLIARARPSVRLCVCLFVTFRCFFQMNEDTMVRFSALGRKIILVGEVQFIRLFAGDHPQRRR